ncbi:CRP/FNR family transcriptional regulator [Cytobacillus eiseniae]|uniref:CRP/FNR family transcriptional regulator n=1 Tax=Cytobacillus eiseniae TaxID=762947 RepID=A0ABS4REH9_9BACI|nr:Crp/Fnr family transcriptional regulator [Cytobacillus eiseniae]MBP2241314.1 CRP/FNR family transcriptional regulator [Cytobacillus eiseniae]
MRIEDIEKRLKAVPLFKDLEKGELSQIVDIAQARLYKNKLYVFMQGDPLDRVFFIHSGKIKIFKTDSSGREQIVSVLEAGEMFPHAGFFRQGNYPAHAEVMEEAQLIAVPIDDFERILLANPILCIKLFKVLGEKIVDLQNRLEEQILHNTYEQIIMLLLRLTRTNGIQQDSCYKITTHFTNRELANMIGTSRETVSRTLNQLKKKEFLFTDEEGFFLINRNQLKQEIL